MSMTTSVRIGPVRALGYGGQRAHDLREGKVPPYVAQGRSKTNVGGFIPTIEEMHEYNEDAKIAAQKTASAAWMAAKASGDPEAIAAAKAARSACRLKYDRSGVVAYRFVFTFGHEAQKAVADLDPTEVDAMAWEAMHRVADTLGTVTVGMGCHRDESALHYHGFLRAVMTSGKKLNPGKGQCRQIQTVAAEAFKRLGIRRGKSKEMWIEEDADPSKYIHASVAELHARLPLELAAARQAVEAARAELDRIQTEATMVDLGKMMAEDEAENLQECVSELRDEIARLRGLGGQWDHYIHRQEAYSDKLDAEIDAKNWELDKLLGIVHGIREQQSIDEHVQHERELDAKQGQKAQEGPEV
ncbi:MAG TPA: hypothetical protein DGF30_08070 [Desulfomicrobium sp.]|nr:hypothetical protein [Desulfomicrobium sp.]